MSPQETMSSPPTATPRRFTGLIARIRRFRKDARGVSAVEFAMVLPVMAVMYLGTVELTGAISANRKVTASASAMGDLAAQATDITNTDMDNILNASSAVMQPFSATPLQLRVSQIRIDASRRATIGWSDGRGLAPLARGSVYTFAAEHSALNVANTSLILAEVRYAYTSPLGNLIIGTMNMRDDFFLRPRIGDCVRRNNACN